MSILALGSVDTFFQEILDDSLRRRGVEASPGTASYLVALLADQAHRDRVSHTSLERPLAFQLDEALNAGPPAERFERLRTLGDGVLYTTGFFADHFQSKGVAPEYLVGIGTSAYGHAASMLRRNAEDPAGAPDIFRELATRFAEFVEVLTDVANATWSMGATTSKNVLAVYERWLKTGSERLAQTLTAQGLMPTRGPRGVVQ